MTAPAAPPAAPPNIVLVFTDDQGYGDLSSYGHPTIHTPSIDAMAARGVKLTQFYVASPVCSPSRAALMTGCYPKRVGMHQGVLFPNSDSGLHPDEVTIAEVLQAHGYATGCFGKWHLGHHEGLLPTDQGFDVFHGVPYSNDMAQFHRQPGSKYALRLPWMDGTKVVEWEPDQRRLTERQTDAAIDFIRDASASDQPFFAYVPYSMPHIPIYASEAFEGTSPRGPYGDVIEEIDASVGRILETLRGAGEWENTLVIFTSDNGPWLPYGLRGGSAGLLRGGKGTNWEGGQRVPFVAQWPGTIPPGTVRRDVATAMDLFPTLVRLANATAPAVEIDGIDIGDLLKGGRAPKTDARPFLYYAKEGALAGIRRGPWKLLLDGPALFDVAQDVSERTNLAPKNPELVAELEALARDLDRQLEQVARPIGTSSKAVFAPRRP